MSYRLYPVLVPVRLQSQAEQKMHGAVWKPVEEEPLALSCGSSYRYDTFDERASSTSFLFSSIYEEYRV
jgi:hypothetical protein